MATKIINLLTSFKSQNSEGPIKIRGLASTVAVDRAGDTIIPSAWANGLGNYEKNPIILFNHDYDEPIGKCTELKITDVGLEIEALIFPSAGRVYDLIKEGVLKTFSVGFAINDAKYDEVNHGLRITDTELLEISVVSVPCNQDAVFNVSKSFANDTEYANFRSELTGHSSAEREVNASADAGDALKNVQEASMEKLMDPEEIKALAEKIAREAAEKAHSEQVAKAAKEAEEKSAREAAEKAASEATKTAIVTGMTEGAERLMGEVEAKMAAKDAEISAILEKHLGDLNEAKAEIAKMQDSKRHFADRNSGDWKTDKSTYADVEKAVILGLATRKGTSNTSFGKQTLEKVNAHSGVQVSSADFEQVVSTNIEKDIQLELILAPMFREIQMSSATQIIPIQPDAGYAQITTAQTASGSNPNGNLAERGDTYGTPYGGVTMQEVTLSTVKLISQSYLGNETEEDAIMPILPLIRDSIVRSHARGVENAMLLGNHADGVYTSGAFKGLVKLAVDNSSNTQSATAFASEALTGMQLLTARQKMGKYGLRPDDVIYIVSLNEYFNLLKDPAFADYNQVQSQATKMNGEVGRIYGSRVVVCDEFASPAISKHYAVAVNTRNFVVPRLRGFRLETDYSAVGQNTAIVGTQRLGFNEIIVGAKSVHSLQYKAS